MLIKDVCFHLKIPLHYAVKKGDRELVSLLLEHKANINDYNIAILDKWNKLRSKETVWDLISPFKEKNDLLNNPEEKYFDLINLLIKHSPSVYEKPFRVIDIDGAKYDILCQYFPADDYYNNYSCIEFLTRTLLNDKHPIYKNISKNLIIDRQKEIITKFINFLSPEQKKQCPLILDDGSDRELNQHYIKTLGILYKESIDTTIDHIVFALEHDNKMDIKSNMNNMLPFLLQNVIILNDLIKRLKSFLLCIYVNKDLKKRIPKPILRRILDIIIGHNNNEEFINRRFDEEKLTLDRLIKNYTDEANRIDKGDHPRNLNAEDSKKAYYNNNTKEELKKFFYEKAGL